MQLDGMRSVGLEPPLLAVPPELEPARILQADAPSAPRPHHKQGPSPQTHNSKAPLPRASHALNRQDNMANLTNFPSETPPPGHIRANSKVLDISLLAPRPESRLQQVPAQVQAQAELETRSRMRLNDGRHCPPTGRALPAFGFADWSRMRLN
jgi:hypothetical protein